MDHQAEAPPARRRPFQFRLRTLFLLALTVALYGSVANSLEGFWRLGALLLLTALLLGIFYGKARLYGALTIVCAAPILTALIAAIVAVQGNPVEHWPELAILGEAVGIAFSIVYAAAESCSR